MDKWKFVGGNFAIDFVNSIGGRNEKRIDEYIIRDEKLNNYDDLAEWAKEIGVINQTISKRLLTKASKNPEEAKKVFERAMLLRESFYRIFRHIIEGAKPLAEDLQFLNEECAIARENQTLIYSSNKFSWSFNLSDDNLDVLLWYVALSGSELLVSEDLSRLKRCPGEDCGWLFYDISKNRSRQWCDMKDCGNFEKVRRFRERQK